jgi:hypothetical protein
MMIRHLVIVSAVVILAATVVNQANGTLQAQTARPRFLTPLPSRFLIYPGDPAYPPEACPERGGRHCLPLLTFGGISSDGLPTIEPAFKSYLPHVRVSFVLQRIDNEIVLNDGVELDPLDPYVETLTTSSAASVEHEAGSYSFDGPQPGGTLHFDYAVLMYDALVYNACDSFSVFPVEHTASLHTPLPSADLGATFHGVDNSTVDSTGFYNFHYTVRLIVGDRISNIHFSGKVNVTCTGVTALP